MDMFGWSRNKAALINCIVILIASLPCVLGYNVWSNLHLIGGRDVLDSEDFIVSNLLLPIGSLIYLLFCVTKWGWGFEKYCEEANTGDGIKISKKLKPYVQYRIGKMFCYGLGTEQDYEKAFEWFERSAKQKNKFAQFSLANLYYYGSGVEKDLSQAFLWYQRSSSQGQPYAAYSIAQMYRYGEYVTKDNDTAQRYYQQALSAFLKIESDDMANDDLFYKLGQMFKLGLGTDSDVTKAIEYFRRSAEMNNKNGLFEYGKALLIGEHIPQDADSAVKLLEKAVKLKNSNAKRFLALEYISGEHLEQDFEKGIALLTECADLSLIHI